VASAIRAADRSGRVSIAADQLAPVPPSAGQTRVALFPSHRRGQSFARHGWRVVTPTTHSWHGVGTGNSASRVSDRSVPCLPCMHRRSVVTAGMCVCPRYFLFQKQPKPQHLAIQLHRDHICVACMIPRVFTTCSNSIE
jgi:hypothetical protein